MVFQYPQTCKPCFSGTDESYVSTPQNFWALLCHCYSKFVTVYCLLLFCNCLCVKSFVSLLQSINHLKASAFIRYFKNILRKCVYWCM